LAQVPFAYDDLWRQWLPVADAMGRADKNTYLAGDGLRPLGADAAEVTGRLAASACLADMGLQTPDQASDLRTLRRLQRFARGVAKAFPWPDRHVKALAPDTVLCRCEGISISSAKAAADLGGAEVNRIKSLARVGMGRCQGRYCQLAEAELAAMWQGRPTGEVGRLRQQAPARPTPVSAWLPGKP
jgi:bacterioferritin-associated ferredoxin